MCTQIFLEEAPNGVLETVKQIRDFGWEVLPEDYEDDEDDDVCLCGVDVEAILHRAKVVFYWDAFGYSVGKPSFPDDKRMDKLDE